MSSWVNSFKADEVELHSAGEKSGKRLEPFENELMQVELHIAVEKFAKHL